MGTDAPRTTGHRARNALVTALVGVLALGLVAAGLGWWTVQRSFPATGGRLAVVGLDESVTIARDESGVPHVTASNDHDLFFAQGYVHAQDRFWEMDFRRHVTAGRLAELFGPDQLPTDEFVRTLGWRAVAEAEFELLDETSRAYYEAYAAGVNAYLDERSGPDLALEYAVLGITRPGYEPEPWSPVDSIAWLKAMAWDLRSNLDDELDRALLATELPAEEVARLHPGYDFASKPTTLEGAPAPAAAAEALRPFGAAADPSGDVAAPIAELARTLDALPELIGRGGGEIGSNAWVVSGKHTATGEPMLAGDPHLGPAMPSVWYQVGLSCEQRDDDCHFDVAGYSFSGLPGIVIGHNDRIAWSMANLGADVADLFLEHVRGEEYELDGSFLPLTVREERLEVAGGDPVVIRVRSTDRGPIVAGDAYDRIAGAADSADDDVDTVLSLQWTALTPGRTASAIFAVNRARDWTAFRAAAARFEVPAQSLVYADVDGNIGYQAPGTIPVRRSGDGSVPLPGWTSANGWDGSIPFDALPSAFNPARGYLIAANSAVTAGGKQLTADWDHGYRAARIEALIRERIDAGEPITLDDFAEMQADTLDANALAFQPVLEGLEGLSGDAARGRELLVDWDARADADSPATAYFAVFWRNLLDDLFVGRVPEGAEPTGGDRWIAVVGRLLGRPDATWWTNEELGTGSRDELLTLALGQAWTELAERQGDDPAHWEWGRLHTLSIRNASLGRSGIPPVEWLLNRGPYELPGGSAIVDAVGWDASVGYEASWVPSMRMLVDLDDLDESRWIDLTGTSGHAFHPNYGDQTDDWRNGRTRPWPFTDEAVIAATRQTLVLLPGAEPAAGRPGG